MPATTPGDPAVRILLRAYWSWQGWRPSVQLSDEDKSVAVRAGVMWPDALSMSHDEAVERAACAATAVTQTVVTQAFLASLTSRRLELRSALGSLAVGRHLRPHALRLRVPGSADPCTICGLRQQNRWDRNVLNFERFKWGGVRRDDVLYVAHDLEVFAAADHVAATADDKTLWTALLSNLAMLPAETTAPKAASTALRGLSGNRAEREGLLGILGVCGILETTAHRGYANSFVRMEERVLPPHRFVDLPYPVCWWRARDGINLAALQRWGLPAP